MASLQGFRNSSPASPFRFLYGVRNGSLLFPLDVAFEHFNPDTPDPTGKFVSDVVAGAGFAFGRITAYAWPAVGAVNPVVTVAPDPAFPLGGVTVLPGLPLPVVASGTRAVVDLAGSSVQGTILAFVGSAAYIDPAHTVPAYIAQFDVPLLPDHHGAPVFAAADGVTLIGMVTATQRAFNAPNALVCPV